ncbi:MAG: DUF4062 domain-containing protein [bacterium]
MDQKRYQIFISSTYLDLIEARNKVMEAILNIYHFPIGMEMFSAADDEQWKVIQDTIDTSDYYILIIGQRYGSVTTDGISYTEKEYNYAKSKGIPILSFVRDRNVSTTPEEREDEAEKIEKLNYFVEEVTSGRMCSFWKTPDELTKEVLVALSKAFNTHPRIGWIRADQGITPEISKEITELTKENRNLREENESLKTQMKDIKPELSVALNDTECIKLNYNENYTPFSVNRISLDGIPEHLLEYIDDKDIEEYNDNLPPVEIINSYNKERELYWRIKNADTKLKIKVINNGFSKANEIYVDIDFPEEILVMDKSDINGLEEPKEPEMPLNPVNEAKKRYKEATRLSSIFDNPGLNRLATSTYHMPDIANIDMYNTNPNSWCTVEDNKISIWLKNLLHTRFREFDEKLLMIPLQKGNFEILVSIICEEYTEEKTFSIPIVVS